MSIRKKIKENIRGISEADYRILLAQLFEAMNYQDVKITHGTQEFGKDIVFYDKDKFGEKTWYSCVVKKGDVNQQLYGDIQRQVAESLIKPFDHHVFGKVKVTKVFVITTGVFKDNVRSLIVESINNGENIVRFFEGSNIAELIEEHGLQHLFADQEIKDVAQALQKAKILEKLNDNNTIKFLETDYGVVIDSIEDFRINVRTKSKELFNERSEYVDEKEHSVTFKLLPEITIIIGYKKPFLLHGIATSGKTTILKKLGKDFLKIQPDGYLFYFELNKIAKNKSFNIITEIEKDYFSATSHQFNWENKVQTLVLLDGLDEITDDEIRSVVIDEILLLKSKERYQIILTSRTIDFLYIHEKVEPGFEKFELLPLNYNEMVQIGNKILTDPSQAKQFVHLIKNSELLRSFPKTPLTTILLAILLKEEKLDIKELPKNITELYSKFIDLFLNKWDKEKGISEQYKITEKEFVIKKLADHLHKNNQVFITEKDLWHFLNKLKEERPIDILKNPKEFIENLCDRSSLIVKDKTDNTFKFFHLTLQEYLTAATLASRDEYLLVDNFLNDWWLNANIFYAGRNPSESTVLKKIASLEKYPLDFEEQLRYIVNTSKVLQAVHLWDNSNRKSTIISMLKVFEGMISIIVATYIGSDIITLRNKTLLDVVLWARNFFNEFFDSTQFVDSLKSIWADIMNEPRRYNEIIRYCIAYNLSLREHSSKYLEEFLSSDDLLNARWFKIVYVDINVKKLKHSDQKLILKFKQKATDNKKYIQDQFKQKLQKHYQSITGLPPVKKKSNDE